MNNQLSEVSETNTTGLDTFDITDGQLPKEQHKKYGRMIVLYQSQRFLITLGPDYPCFIIAVVLFIVLYVFTIMHIYKATENQALRLASVTGAVLQIIVYVALAISNPGILTQESVDTQDDQSGKTRRFCRHCKISMPPRSRHCSQCQVCIKGYDHHCPWSTKCIGQNNLVRFYIFCFYTISYIFFCIISLTIQANQQ